MLSFCDVTQSETEPISQWWLREVCLALGVLFLCCGNPPLRVTELCMITSCAQEFGTKTEKDCSEGACVVEGTCQSASPLLLGKNLLDSYAKACR